MKITVLGNSGPYPRAGSACSGYLIEDEENKILIDCGNGTLSRLLTIIGTLNKLDAIILTHLHSDHIGDVMVMRYALGLNNKNGVITKSIPLYAPKDPSNTFNQLQYKDAFNQQEINPDNALVFNNLKISFYPVLHPITTYGVVVQKGNKKFVYTSDTKKCNILSQMAKDSDLLLSECNLLEKDKTKNVYHLSAKDVGEIATESGVKKLLLTHIWPEYNTEDILEEANNYYSGDLEIACELKCYEL